MADLYDVAVIGAGPVGSHLAARLATRRHHVVVLERNRSLTAPVVCTGIVGRECLAAYSFDEHLVSRWAYGARLFSPSGRELRFKRRSPQAAIIDRPGLNVSLAARAQGRGATFLLGTRVEGVTVEGDAVTVVAVRDGEDVSLRSRAVVLASGLNPGLTQGLGLGRITDVATGAQVEVPAPGLEEVEVYTGQQVAPGFFGWLVPTTPGLALAGLITRRDAAAALQRLLQSLQAAGRIGRPESEPQLRPMPFRPLARTFASRVLVVGAAAGQVKPTSGGGIYYGLLCADIAAEHLSQALAEDDLSARRLAAYQQRWRQKVGREIVLGHLARRIYQRLTDEQLEQLFDIAASEGLLDALAEAEDLSFDWHGAVIRRLLSHRAVLRALAVVGLPGGFWRKFGSL